MLDEKHLLDHDEKHVLDQSAGVGERVMVGKMVGKLRLALLVIDFAYQHEDDVAVLGSRHRRGAGFTLSGHTKNIMRHEP